MFLFSAIRFEETDRKFNRQRLYGARSRKHEPVSLRRLALRTVIDDLYAVWPVKRQTIQVNSTDGAVLIVDILLTPSSSTCTRRFTYNIRSNFICTPQVISLAIFHIEKLGTKLTCDVLPFDGFELFALTATAQH